MSTPAALEVQSPDQQHHITWETDENANPPLLHATQTWKLWNGPRNVF